MTDEHMPDLVAIALDCLSNPSVTNLNIDLSGSSITDTSLNDLSQLSGLDTLDLQDTRVTEAIVSKLRGKLTGTVVKH